VLNSKAYIAGYTNDIWVPRKEDGRVKRVQATGRIGECSQ